MNESPEEFLEGQNESLKKFLMGSLEDNLEIIHLAIFHDVFLEEFLEKSLKKFVE